MKCPSPKPTNGSINSTSTHYLAAVTVTCDDGYNLIGDSEIRCELDATWSSSPTCKLIDCGDPTPDFGYINTTSTTNGTVAMVSCDEGHELQGENVIICQPSEEWTDNPSCIIK
ncbi:sushi, von Willebrand factor type A, EGF and pentraxin domain-containing protein 1-like, partial [Ruditapes philippinarum]|uniref:sushi, von Willebrand factor type A, EGF and pentraxin domain-containing protein 1-like n=1 Tax=Ruditapes philippinarum TaxID=129788 RepID=UPI00295BF022